jgi:peptide/nickel transport system permease protein
MSRLFRRLGASGTVGLVLVLLLVLAAVFAPLVAPYDPLEVDLDARLAAPDAAHLLGTDQAGRDVLSRILHGARSSLSVGIGAVAIGLLLGVGAGVAAAYHRGGWTEALIMRVVDAIAAIPLLIWAIALVGILGVGPVALGPVTLPNEAKIVGLVGFMFSPVLARVTHAVASGVVVSDYVRARRLQGAGAWSIMTTDVLPNCLSPIIVQATLLVAIGIVIEASVSFVGLGVQPPRPSWGTMLSDARSAVFTGEWWLPVFPGLAISLAVVGFNLLGDSVRDILDPRGATRGLVA